MQGLQTKVCRKSELPKDGNNTLSFLSLFFWKKARKTTKRTRIFLSLPTPKIPGKEGKNARKNKEFLAGEKKQGIPKKQGKEGQGSSLILGVCGSFKGQHD